MTDTPRINRLDAMQIFVRVAELSSFTRAAESLGLPKASMSAAVQKLEKMLGVRLLHRTTRRVQMTQDGRAFYERCKDLLADMDELQSMFQQSPQALRGRLRVDMPSRTARDYVIPRLPEFLREHPHLEFELSSTDRKVDLVREGFDCVLRVGSLADAELVARPLGVLTMGNVASPAYLAAHGTPATLADLSQHRIVHYAAKLGTQGAGWEYQEEGDRRVHPMRSTVVVNGTDAYQAACLAGLGLIQAPTFGTRRLVEQGLLVEVMPQFVAPPMPVSLLYPNRRQLAPRVQAVLNWIAQVVEPQLEPQPRAATAQ